MPRDTAETVVLDFEEGYGTATCPWCRRDNVPVLGFGQIRKLESHSHWLCEIDEEDPRMVPCSNKELTLRDPPIYFIIVS